MDSKTIKLESLKNRRSKLGSIGAIDFLIQIEEKRNRNNNALTDELSKLPNNPGLTKDNTSLRIPEFPLIAGREALFRDYLTRAETKQDSTDLDATILRTDSLNGRELLAWRASGGFLDERGIRALAETSRCDSFNATATTRLQAILDPEWALRLARVLMVQSARPDDICGALVLVDCFFRHSQATRILRRFGRLFFDVALSEGKVDLARGLLEENKLSVNDSEIAKLDLGNPLAGVDVDPKWLRKFNRYFTDHGLEPVRLTIPNTSDDDWPPFDRLHCAALAGSVDGPLVSVIVTAFNPHQGLVTSVRSILQQTYRNIEVIIIDDASTDPESARFLEQCKELDSRVKIHVQPVNGGTYVARNTGLQLASGELVTGQDSDDWSHPRRIEWQIKPLLTDPALPATLSFALKCSPNFMLGDLGRPIINPNASSLMCRRHLVLNRLGGYDPVRKAADNELIGRIDASFEKGVFYLSETPLAIVRRAKQSLSGSDFKPGWRHPARRSYRRAYEHWHDLIRAGKSTPWCNRKTTSHPFPIPDAYFPTHATKNFRKLDVVFVGDWVSYGGPQKSMLQEIQALLTQGLGIGVCHMEAYRFMTGIPIRPLCEEIRSMIHHGTVREVLLSEPIEARLVILRYPPILQFTPKDPAQWKIDKGLIIANQTPCEKNGADLRYLIGDCIENAKNLFGLDFKWIPQGPHARRAIENIVPRNLLGSVNNPGIIDLKKWTGKRTKGIKKKLHIGRYSRDSLVKFPATKQAMLKIYPQGSEFDVKILGGKKTVHTLFGNSPIPDNWTVYLQNSIPVEQFLDSIDVFVYFDNPNIIEAFGRSILEAMASGCVVVLPKKFEEVFGDGPIYAEEHDVFGILERLRCDHDYFLSRQAMTQKTVIESFSYESFFQWIQIESEWKF